MSVISHTYPVDDPILDYRHAGNLEIKLGKVVYRYNSSGFRDVDHELEKPLGIKRIVVVGDSVAEGHGVEWESVLARIIQNRLSDEEVINIAGGGLNTPQEIHLLEESLVKLGYPSFVRFGS